MSKVVVRDILTPIKDRLVFTVYIVLTLFLILGLWSTNIVFHRVINYNRDMDKVKLYLNKRQDCLCNTDTSQLPTCSIILIVYHSLLLDFRLKSMSA